MEDVIFYALYMFFLGAVSILVHLTLTLFLLHSTPLVVSKTELDLSVWQLNVVQAKRSTPHSLLLLKSIWSKKVNCPICSWITFFALFQICNIENSEYKFEYLILIFIDVYNSWVCSCLYEKMHSLLSIKIFSTLSCLICQDMTLNSTVYLWLFQFYSHHTTVVENSFNFALSKWSYSKWIRNNADLENRKPIIKEIVVV